MAGHPLRPATRRRLGRPSPHQQADRPRAHPTPQKLSTTNHAAVVLSGIRPSFPGLSRSAGQITHVLLTRSPLEYPRKGLSVRLACVKHAASVRPEPESNSPNKNLAPTGKAEFESEQSDLTKRHQKLASKKTTPQHGKIRAWQKNNNKQKPPNTLLSSQTTHPPAAQQARGTWPLTRSADEKEPTEVDFPLGRRRARRTNRVATTDKLREGKLGVKWPARRRVSGRRLKISSTRSTPAIFRLPRRSTSQRPCRKSVGWGTQSSSSICCC